MPFASRQGFQTQPAAGPQRTALTISQQGSTNVVVNTTTYQVGNGSAKFPGTNGNGLFIQNGGGELNLLTSDFTIEFWFSQSADGGQFQSICSNYYSGTGYVGWANGRFNMVPGEAAATKFRVAWNQSGTARIMDSTTSIAYNGTWYHIAFQRSGNTWKLFVNGTAENTQTYSGNFTIADNYWWTLGKVHDNTGNWPGYLDEFRVSNIARYSGNFTPSTSAFANDANTLCLIHFDGSSGQSTFTDDNS